MNEEEAGGATERAPACRARVSAQRAITWLSNPRKTARDRAAYIARHRVNENHGDPLT